MVGKKVAGTASTVGGAVETVRDRCDARLCYSRDRREALWDNGLGTLWRRACDTPLCHKIGL
jgi:hypothetical protein